MKDTATCYAWGKSGNWEAICVDYDLTAQGGSLEEVRRELDDAIETFLSRVRELPKSEQARLLNRKAPPRVTYKTSCFALDFSFVDAYAN